MTTARLTAVAACGVVLRVSFRRAILIALALYAGLFALVFARGLLAGATIADGDAQFEYFPQFGYPTHAWTSQLFGGYPLAADPQNATFSPTRLFFSLFGAWNAYAISALVIAATTTFAYAFEVTGSFAGAIVAGVVFGANGYLLRNFHLTPMLQTVAWMPLLFWSIERSVCKPAAATTFVGAAAIALAIFGGYPQPGAYMLVAGGLYALVGLTRTNERRAFAIAAAGIFIGGLALAAIQLAPTFELFSRSERVSLPFGQFAGWSWLPVQISELVVPRAFVGRWATSGACLIAPDADHAYFSLLGLALGAMGAFYTRRDRATVFWLAVMVFSVVFALGDATPLASILFHVPPFKMFRDPVRHMVLFGLGLSLLSAHAIAKTPRPAVAISVLGGLTALGLVVAVGAGCTKVSAPAAIATVVAFAASAAAIASRRPYAIAAVAALDLATFDGAFDPKPTYGGHPIADRSYFEHPPTAEIVGRDRVFAVRGQIAPRDELPVNANLLWKVSSAAGYSPIAPRQSLDAMGIAYFGAPIRTWWLPDDRTLDIAAVRWVTLPDPIAQAEELRGIPWYPLDLGLTADAKSPALDIALPDGVFDRVALTLDLWNSLDLPDGTAVATVDGEPLRTGVDVADWAVDCLPSQHHRAEVLEARPVRLNGPCIWSRYLVERRGSFTGALHVRWTGNDHAILRIHRVTVGDVPVLPPAVALAHDPRWRIARSGGVLLAENLRALPRAFLVGRVASVADPLAVVRSGQLGDRPWEPRDVALTQSSGDDRSFDPTCGRGTVTWTRDEDEHIALDVASPARCYLVLADTAYPGWHAIVDETEMPIDRVNVGRRGIVVPAGRHRIRFDFAPHALWAGALVTMLALAAFGALTIFGAQRRSRISSG